jgi:hypothetical protein
MDIRLGEWDGQASTEVKVPPRDFASSIRQILQRLPPLIYKGTGDE